MPLIKQPGPKLFFAGLVFMGLSSFATRRALIRRKTPVVQMPAQARQQYAQMVKASERQAAGQGPTGAPAHTTTPPPNSAPGTSGAGRPQTFQTKGQTSEAAHQGGAPGYNAGAQTAAAEGVAPQTLGEAVAPELHNSGAVMAVEALGLASLNVFSAGMAAIGGAMWYLDIRSMDELKKQVRGGMGADGSGRSEDDVEEEMEEWIVSVLARKEQKEAARKAIARNERGRLRSIVEADNEEEEEALEGKQTNKKGWLW